METARSGEARIASGWSLVVAELMPRVLVPLAVSLQMQCATCTGISFLDSTALAVCHNARRGKTSVGWFYGCKLHLVVNDRGEVLAFCRTPGNVDDRRPVVPRLVRRLFGKLFGDRGAISRALAEQLFTTHALLLITKLRKHLRERLLAYTGTLPLRERALIKSVNDQLKNSCQIAHTHHRSPPISWSTS